MYKLTFFVRDQLCKLKVVNAPCTMGVIYSQSGRTSIVLNDWAIVIWAASSGVYSRRLLKPWCSSG